MATPTLHDFVLNLLTDPAARTAFELDPEAVLVDAGLGDITEADVQEVIPLVVDYAPIGGLTGLVGVDEPVLGGLDGDVAGAVRQLQGITQLADAGHNHGSDVTVNATAAAGVSADLDGSADLDLSLLDRPLLDDSLLDDPAGALDAADPVVSTAEPVLHAAVTQLDPVTGTVDSLGLGGITGTADPAAIVDPATTTVTHTVDSTVSGVTGSVSGDGLLGDLLDSGDGHDGGLLGLH
jgi:hypothetical protein